MTIPSIGLGTWKLSDKECERTIHQTWELEYRHIDTADVYRNHQATGLSIRAFPREQLFLTTKLSINDLTPSKIREAASRIFRRAESQLFGSFTYPLAESRCRYDRNYKNNAYP